MITATAKVYSEEAAAAWLNVHLPTWQVSANYLVRIYKTGGWQTTLLLANTIGFLAEAAWHHPELTLGYKQVMVRLQTHDAGNVITDKDMELAQQIEQMVLWKPASHAALAGTTDPWVKG